MTNRLTAISLSVVSIIAPLNSPILANQGEGQIIEQMDKEQERIEQEKAEQEKLRVLEIEAKKAEAFAKEMDRRASISVDPYDIRVASHLKTSELKAIFENTDKASNMVHLAPAFIDAEKVYGVNALALAGIVALESSWNTSRRAIEQNNLTGYAVYSDSSNGKDFLSPYECIMETARLIDKDYLSEEGQWYNGHSLESINVMYSSYGNWYNEVGSIAKSLLDEYKAVNADTI